MTRTRICFYILLLTPLLVYWQTIFSEYGMRDDYAQMREAREEPGKIVRFSASVGRPLFGALLESSFAKIDEVENLQWPRLGSVLLLTVLGLALWRQLYQSGWTEIEAAAVGLGVTLLPAAEVTVGWAIGWPWALAVLLSLAGFAAIEAELERGGLKRAVALVGGAMIYGLAGLIYQPDALFALVPMAAVLFVRSGREPYLDLRWFATHLAALLTGLLGSFFLVKTLFSNGVFHESARMHFETNPFTKLAWFLWEPLPNALALYSLRDNFNTGAVVFWGSVIGVAALIGYGYRENVAKHGDAVKKKWLVCLLFAPFAVHAVSLVAGERSIGYRVLYGLSGLVLVLVVYTLRSLLEAGRIKPVLHYATLGVMILSAAIAAHQNSYGLIAAPQGHEWEMIRNVVERTDFSKAPKVYVVTPAPEDRSTERMFVDEFGSISSDSDWAPGEMFKAAFYQRYPGKPPIGIGYTLKSGREVPAAKAYDLVIDMRKLKEFRGK